MFGEAYQNILLSIHQLFCFLTFSLLYFTFIIFPICNIRIKFDTKIGMVVEKKKINLVNHREGELHLDSLETLMMHKIISNPFPLPIMYIVLNLESKHKILRISNDPTLSNSAN